MSSERWAVRPQGSNWGNFGPDDQIGRLNLISTAHRRAAAAEVREGIVFCLSLPLDCPRHVSLHPRRQPPALDWFLRGQDPTMNYPMARVTPGQTDIVNDDRAALSLQFSTQWDSLCHIGAQWDAHDDDVCEATYYNGYRANADIRGPVDYIAGETPREGPYGAFALGIETIAETGMQTRGVMVDLFAHVGLERVAVGYDMLMRILDADGVEVGEGDVLCLRTGFDRALLARYVDPAAPFDQQRCSGLDGADERLQRWIDDSGLVAIVSDNEAVELLPNGARDGHHGTHIPLHHLCLFKLGIPLGEMFLLSDLADWLRANGRSRFLFTAPPLRLPGAVGSPVTGVGTV
ncbi:cyclase family protein [uncultured Sphingomonas sp.]|uniref:cyclase family protein n=1 Tax=uncultured Sphingomonas sp. TaxID=158754 RepID=UPI00262CBFA4|nr:cyclase family protein [uncultured Sphingomonas sp.]